MTTLAAISDQSDVDVWGWKGWAVLAAIALVALAFNAIGKGGVQ